MYSEKKLRVFRSVIVHSVGQDRVFWPRIVYSASKIVYSGAVVYSGFSLRFTVKISILASLILFNHRRN